MKFNIGDIIIHWTYGLGTVIGIDQKDISGLAQHFYIVRVGTFDIWVPFTDENNNSIRSPTESSQFTAHLDILRKPGELLPENQYKRKIELRERMQKRSLGDLCHVIRDLSDRSLAHPLNLHDSSVLFHAEESLLDEWVISLGTERSYALSMLKGLLRGDLSEHEGQKDGYPTSGSVKLSLSS